MRKIVIIVIVACLVLAVVLSSMYLNSKPAASASASGSPSTVQGSMVVWNVEKDQKLLETTDASAIGSVISFIKKATFSSVKSEPVGSNVKSKYYLTIYDQSGKSDQYSMLYMNDNTIVLVYLKANNDGTYLQASFPVQAGGLNDYLKFSATASASAASAASAASSTAASTASAS